MNKPPKEGDAVYVEDEHGNKRPGKVISVCEDRPGDQFPSILVEWTQAMWFNVNEVTPVPAVDQLGDLVKDSSTHDHAQPHARRRRTAG